MTNQEKQKIYDDICGKAFINIYSTTKDSQVVCLSPFNVFDKEHRFVLGVAKGVAHIFGRDIVIDASPLVVWWINRKIKDKECRVKRMKRMEREYCDPRCLVDFMRPYCKEKLGENFNFGQIYDEYYRIRKDK